MLPRALVALAAVLVLAGCGTSGGGGTPDDNSDGGGGTSTDLWLIDDVDLNAAVLEGAVEGVTVVAFTCDLASSFGTTVPDSPQYPRASVVAVLGGTSISYDEETLSATAQGTLTLPSDVPATLEISSDEGWWGINAGDDDVTSWTPSVTMTVTEVPVPVDGCAPSHVFGEGLIRDGGTAAEVIAAFTETGLRDVSAECPDKDFTWTPPDMSCEEYAPLDW